MKKTALIFILGGLFGSASTWNYVKKKYEKIAQDEIDSVKKTFSDMVKKPDDNEDIKSKEKASEKDKTIYNDILDNVNYSSYSEPEKNKEVKPVDGPYVIPPEDFGEYNDYEALSWTYYADKYLADEDDDLVDDIEGTVGYDSLNHFGEYEDDTVFVRNEDLKTDYEIMLDERKYADIYDSVDHQQED
ncbi:hypothetical protein [[Clostridium] innocuum]|uniref:hypothetical protein n=1 Tax=Clostridium innocuum TaxID=1522 RepID=UPI001E5B7C1D|nr:hypothetical protein [[Clostridium] innocuum]DAU14249.1 MAG TPA: hypothetical protein [Caudoviricetes sp.]MCC2832073.1 hypothetical protein [[Clostridium] innocuum]MCR0246999.1 hypothetical protein [[Clostridium] innocuum]MCR0258361.1 hypothetical protein [[Clostridium] innocuum]MCR0391059.1 hypothetical protein [[Clostridium] innocuum]